MNPRVPSDLAARGRGRAFWKQAVGEYELDPGEVELLAEVCRCLDLLDELRLGLADEPMTVSGRTHPLIVEQRLQRVELRRLIGALALPNVPDQEEDEDSEPVYGSQQSQRAQHAARRRWGVG